MLHPRLTLLHLAPLVLAGCLLPSPRTVTSPLRTPRPGDRFDLPVPPAPRTNEVGVIEAGSAAESFRLEPTAPAGPPALRLEFEEGLGGTLGTPVPLALHVTNDGPGAAHDLIVLAALPPELAGPDDRAVLELQRPELAPGETASLRAPLTAHRAGRFTVDALASSLDGPIVGPVRAEVLVREPATGEAGVARLDEVNRIEALEAVLASAAAPGPPAAPPDDPPVGEPAPAEEALASGDGALRLRVLAEEGRVYLGDRTDDPVRVTNTGHEARHELTLRTSLVDGIDVVSCSGATEVRFEGDEFHADALASLAPGESAEWRLVARSYRPGTGRVRFTLLSDDESVAERTVTTSFAEFGDL